ncbi:Os04g0364900 [Oryza sativa Japonica Group]|uniref:Uncharacterized protein n=2 Tax=Oryza sativa subsp. japonica TaxID=39947 RepID=A0A8J8Y095_ORYSJ|nr:hypothetical protein OsJ_14432 [Oryza sativa Japonica Group]BAS88782.1 Os04g0364900 [Oryza sativa Japonica Group]
MMPSTLAAGASWHLAANKCTPTATVELAVKPNRNPKCQGCCWRNHTYPNARLLATDVGLRDQGGDYVARLRPPSATRDWLPAAMRGPNAIAVSPDVWDALGLGTTCTKDRK